jgi:hypothetical protein
MNGLVDGVGLVKIYYRQVIAFFLRMVLLTTPKFWQQPAGCWLW